MLDPGALATWIAVTLAFIAVIGLLYRKVARRAKAGERKDEAPAY